MFKTYILQIISFLGNPALLKSCYKKKKKRGEVLNFYKTYMFERTKKKKKMFIYVGGW